jgi:hypothetical protein
VISRCASMPPWLVVLFVIAIVLGLTLVVAVRRPRTIEDELHQASPASPRSPAPATPAAPSGQAPLATTIQALTRNRATGKLEVRSGDQTCSLYFLFGHLFHAESGGLKGEDALQVALAWAQPTALFDPKAHLPSQETILRPPA